MRKASFYKEIWKLLFGTAGEQWGLAGKRRKFTYGQRSAGFKPFRRIYRLVSSLLFPLAPSLTSCTTRIVCVLQVFVYSIDSSQKNSIFSAPTPLKVLYKLYKRRDIVCKELTHFFDSWYFQKKVSNAHHVKIQNAEGRMQLYGTLNPDKNYYISASLIDIFIQFP